MDWGVAAGVCVVGGWVVGLVAGKMGNGSVAEGFKHSLLLVVISIAAIYIAALFIPIKF